MSDISELDNFLETSVEAEVVEQPVEAKQEAATTETSTTTETTDKGANNAETPSAEKDSTANDIPEDGYVPVAAQINERKKRQAAESRAETAEREAEAVKRELEQLRNPKAKQDETPDVFVDQHAFTEHLRAETKREILKNKAEMSADFMRNLKPDYDEKAAKFVEMARANPVLADQMYASPNPAKFAYETAEAVIAAEEERVIAKYLAKQKAENPAAESIPEAKKPIDKTPSLATASAARSNNQIPSLALEDLFER